MGMIKAIEIDGKEVLFKASAAVPRIYRMRFGRDIFTDLQSMENGVATTNGNGLDIGLLNMFENVAFVMAKHADPSIPDTPEEWLDGFDTFSIYQVLPEIIDLWQSNTETTIQSKKK